GGRAADLVQRADVGPLDRRVVVVVEVVEDDDALARPQQTRRQTAADETRAARDQCGHCVSPAPSLALNKKRRNRSLYVPVPPCADLLCPANTAARETTA